MILTLHVASGFGDTLEGSLLRIEALDKAVIFDAIEVDVTGIGETLYDRLRKLQLRAPVITTERLASMRRGLLKK